MLGHSSFFRTLLNLEKRQANVSVLKAELEQSASEFQDVQLLFATPTLTHTRLLIIIS